MIKKPDWKSLFIFCNNTSCLEHRDHVVAKTRAQIGCNYIGSFLGDHWYECPRCGTRQCFKERSDPTAVGYEVEKEPWGKWATPVGISLCVSLIAFLLLCAVGVMAFVVEATRLSAVVYQKWPPKPGEVDDFIKHVPQLQESLQATVNQLGMWIFYGLAGVVIIAFGKKLYRDWAERQDASSDP